ncbi:MAG: carbohydrate binding domain-containing protein [Gemmataceae bacterium]
MLSTLLVVCLGALSAGQNLIANGSFEQIGGKPDVPADWAMSGNRAVVQQLGFGVGRDGKRCGRLICSAFREGGPDHHAMLCQVGKVGVRRGHWYRLSLWARAKDLKEGAVEIGLVNTHVWNNIGLAEAFRPRSAWRRFEFIFRAREDLPAEASRLQFWFKSTGELWLDDVELVETAAGQRWLPTIEGKGVKNLVPNSSFECGTANWGSFTWGLSGWAGNLYRLEGELDDGNAQHGQTSLKIALNPTNYPVFWFDYFQPVRQPVKRVLAANQGWFAVEVGKPLTLSAYLKADQENVAAQLVVQEAGGRMLSRKVTVGQSWQRHTFTARPSQPYVFIAAGLGPGSVEA